MIAALALALFSYSLGVSAQGPFNNYIGCYSSLPSGAALQAGIFTDAQCSVQCNGLSFFYSFTEGTTNACYCSSDMPPIADFTSVSPGGCGASLQYKQYTVGSSFQPPTPGSPCYTFSTPPGGANTAARQCQIACAGGEFLTFFVDVANGVYECSCAVPTNFSPLGCTTGSRFVLSHDGAAQASSLFRRNARERRESELRARNTFCPAGFTACKVDGAIEYECIDTTSELESCGGCLHGEFGKNSAVFGIDCSRGAKAGAATCNNGRCEVSACRSGFLLVDDQCI